MRNRMLATKEGVEDILEIVCATAMNRPLTMAEINRLYTFLEACKSRLPTRAAVVRDAKLKQSATFCPAPNTPSAQTAPTPAAPGPIKRTKNCPIGRDFFATHAKPASVAIEGQQLPTYARPVSFATRSFGWTYKGKTSVTVNGTEVPCWVTMNVTVIRSKDLPFKVEPTIPPQSPPPRPAPQPVPTNVKSGPDPLEKQRFWNKSLKKMGQQDRDVRAAVAMYHERFHEFPKGLRYSPEKKDLMLPVRVFVKHWDIL